jgi:tetratricopeptide (TPR) repeat protein
MSAADGTGYLLDGLHLAEALGDRAAEAELLGWLAVLSGNQLRFDLGVGYGERALRAGRAAGDDRAVASALDGLKSAYAYLGEIGRLAPVIEELEPLARRLGDLWLLQWCLFESSFPLIAAGDWAGATARIEAALEVNRRSGHAGFDAWFTAHLAWVARLAGRLDDALAIGARALAMDTHPWWTGAVAGIQGGSLVEAGRIPEAVKLLEAGLASSTGHGTEAYRLRCLAPLAEITGSPALLVEADAMLRAIGAPPDSVWLYGADTYVAVAGAHLAAGRLDRAREIVAPLLAAGERTGWRAPLAGAVALAGRSGLR